MSHETSSKGITHNTPHLLGAPILLLALIGLASAGPGDLDHNGRVDEADRALLVGQINGKAATAPEADCNSDSIVDVGDVLFHVGIQTDDSLASYLQILPTLEVEPKQEIGPVEQVVDGAYTCTIRRVSEANNIDEIIEYTPSLSLDVWPGSILGSNSVLEGDYHSITVGRTPITLCVIGPVITDNCRVVHDPFFGNANAAVNELLLNVEGQQQPQARFHEYINAYNREQVGLQGGLKAVFKHFSFGFNFGESAIKERRSIFVKVMSRYFTVGVAPKTCGSEYFAPGMTASALRSLLPQDPLIPNVPVLISEIAYGRLLVIQMISERSVSAEAMGASFEAKVFTGNATDEQSSIFENSEFRILELGGSSDGFVAIVPGMDVAQILSDSINSGRYWNRLGHGVPLVYRMRFMDCGMKTFRFGLAADYTISECALNAGDNLWRVRSFGCDCGHDNVYRLERDGTPICGSGNCPGAPGTCWGTPYLVGGSDGPGSLDLNGQKDMQYYGEAYLYVSKTANLSGIPFSSDVGRLWVNDVEVQGSPLTLSLKPGCNHIEWTAYNQNSTPRIRISAPLANYVLRMDSALCE